MKIINSNYYVEINEDWCSGCGECVPRCHMEANKINDNLYLQKILQNYIKPLQKIKLSLKKKEKKI